MALTRWLTSALLIVPLCLLACAHGESRRATVTLCDLVRHSDVYLAAPVQISVRYETDFSHYEYLIDDECGSTHNMLDVGRHLDSERFLAFKKYWKDICLARGDTALCVVSERLVVSGQLRMGDSGLVFDVQEFQKNESPGQRTIDLSP